mmetsp:Transcript_21216/g.41494  ORF Transcript_21216/g.41494 Transcript_21216/m.41494 type:complete len:403 (-) Transcript_21216:66-1274(-)
MPRMFGTSLPCSLYGAPTGLPVGREDPVSLSPKSALTDSVAFEPEEGPLWKTVRKQLYRSEVSHVRKLVGESLIQQNKLMWSELAALKQILADFQEQNDSLSASLKQQVQFRGTQHRDLLRRQLRIILDDLRSQAEACGHVLEDFVPELRDQQLCEFLFVGGCESANDEVSKASCMSVPTTPSTAFSSSRPSSASGVSVCSAPDPVTGVVSLPLGRRLDVDELTGVAEGIREALEAEQQSLLTAIGEQTQCLEAEDARRAESKRTTGPSTTQLQELVHRLQDITISPALRALTLTGPPSPPSPCQQQACHGGYPEVAEAGPAAMPLPISGGAHVRRLQAFITQRRRLAASASLASLGALGAVPESPGTAAPSLADFVGVSVKTLAGQKKPNFDPFFDDPFAL